MLARDWSMIWVAIASMLPEDKAFDTLVAQRIRQGIASGELQCWELVAEGEAKPRFAGAVLTTIRPDNFVGTKHLVIYALGGSEHIPLDAWKGAFSTIVAFARGNGCTTIAAQTNNPRVLKIAKHLGFTANTRLLVMET